MGPLQEQAINSRSSSELFIDAATVRLDAGASVPRTKHICVFGTDSCSIAGEILSDSADEMSPYPLTCVRDNRVPGWVDENTLALIVSYSSLCPEMIPVIDELRIRKCAVRVLTSCSPMRDVIDESETILLPCSQQEPEAIGYTLGILASAVQQAGMFLAADSLSNALESVRGDIGILQGGAVRLANVLEGRVGAFYSTSDVHACAVAFREKLSECGRLSFTGELPEFDHNELVGWSDPNSHAPELSMVVLRGTSGSDLVNVIVDCMMEVLEENGRPVVETDIGSGPTMERNIRGIMLAMEASNIMGMRA